MPVSRSGLHGWSDRSGGATEAVERMPNDGQYSWDTTIALKSAEVWRIDLFFQNRSPNSRGKYHDRPEIVMWYYGFGPLWYFTPGVQAMSSWGTCRYVDFGAIVVLHDFCPLFRIRSTTAIVPPLVAPFLEPSTPSQAPTHPVPKSLLCPPRTKTLLTKTLPLLLTRWSKSLTTKITGHPALGTSRRFISFIGNPSSYSSFHWPIR